MLFTDPREEIDDKFPIQWVVLHDQNRCAGHLIPSPLSPPAALKEDRP